eukprot:3812701-Prymnesium_polylepis.1
MGRCERLRDVGLCSRRDEGGRWWERQRRLSRTNESAPGATGRCGRAVRKAVGGCGALRDVEAEGGTAEAFQAGLWDPLQAHRRLGRVARRTRLGVHRRGGAVARHDHLRTAEGGQWESIPTR